ncbi:MAG: protein kinase [Ktedonobacterales bacterium]
MADLELIGQTLGYYRIESLLGVGGMGEVYRAVHVRLNRPAAIKVLHANQAADPTFQARFLREARAAAALSHPNIVDVFDFGEQGDASYMVMEYVPDGSLRTLLKQRSAGNGWSLGLGVNLVRQAADGLAYAHAHGMIHRDIKPDNLLLHRLDPSEVGRHDMSDDEYRLKISDFGLARLVDEVSELTATGMVMGTPAYMSPEQCQGGTLDARSDLYSLGVVLYEVATGSQPFRVKSLSEAVYKHIYVPPTPPRELRPALPVALEEVILKCLAKRPEDRFATAAELAAALDSALGDTEQRTIITASATLLATSTPAALVDPTAPTVAGSSPGRTLSSPPARVAASRPPATNGEAGAVAEEDTGNSLTIPASDGRSTPSSVRVRSAVVGRDAAPTSLRWPLPEGSRASETLNRLRPLLKQPKVLGIGAAALLLIVVLVTVLALNGHGGSSTKAPTVRAHTTPTASPTPIEAVKFQDTLRSPTGKWGLSSHSFYSNGGYEVAGAWTTYAPVNGLGNGTVSVSVRALSGASGQFYGILFRTSNASVATGYFFGITQNGQWTFSNLTDGNSSIIVAPTASTHIAVGPNVSNTITVRAIGSHFVFYINGAQVGQVDNNAYSLGGVGLITTDNSLHVVYNNFLVTTSGS